MIDLQKIEGTNIYTFKIAGEIDSKGIEDMMLLLEIKADEGEQIKMLGEVNEFPTFEDFKSFTETIKMEFKALKGVEKYAIISNKKWIEKILPIGNFFTPNMPIKYFGMNQRKEAIEWLKSDEIQSIAAEDYLSKMDITHIEGTNIYSFTVNGKIDKAGMKGLQEVFAEQGEKEKINLMAKVKKIGGFESFSTFLEGLKVDMAGFGKVKKFAILSDKKWAEYGAKIDNFILPNVAVKAFKLAEEAEAIAWLRD